MIQQQVNQKTRDNGLANPSCRIGLWMPLLVVFTWLNCDTALSASEEATAFADTGFPVELVKQWSQDVTEATPQIGVIEGEDVLGIERKRAFRIATGEEEYIHPGTPPIAHVWSGVNGESFSLRMYVSDAAVPQFPLNDPDREWQPEFSFRWRLIQRTTMLLSATTPREMGWGLERLEGDLKPAPFARGIHSAAFNSGFNSGLVVYGWLRSDYDNFLNGSTLKLSSFKSPAQIFDKAPGVTSSVDRYGSLPEILREPKEYLYHSRKLEHIIRSEVKAQELEPAFNQLLAQSSLPQVMQLYLQKGRNSEEWQKLDAMQEKINGIIADAIEDYISRIHHGLNVQEGVAIGLPRSLSRLYLQSMLNHISEGGTPVPDWLAEGLESRNAWRFGIAIRRHGVYPAMPPPFQPEKNRPPLWRNSNGWNSFVAEITQHQAVPPIVTKSDPGVKDNVAKGSAVLGRSLQLVESKRAVDYFYKKYGAGCVVETLQRLGSGGSVDETFIATTGLTQRQFIEEFRAQSPRRIQPAQDELDENADIKRAPEPR